MAPPPISSHIKGEEIICSFLLAQKVRRIAIGTFPSGIDCFVAVLLAMTELLKSGKICVICGL